jgi:hypothetical protein
MVEIVRADGAATVWDKNFKVDCPKCKRTIFENHEEVQPNPTSPPFKCPNCEGNVVLREQYFLVKPNQDSWPGYEDGDIFSTALTCSEGCGWSANLNRQDQSIQHSECGATIGAKGVEGMSEFELHESPMKKLFSFFKK